MTGVTIGHCLDESWAFACAGAGHRGISFGPRSVLSFPYQAYTTVSPRAWLHTHTFVFEHPIFAQKARVNVVKAAAHAQQRIPERRGRERDGRGPAEQSPCVVGDLQFHASEAERERLSAPAHSMTGCGQKLHSKEVCHIQWKDRIIRSWIDESAPERHIQPRGSDDSHGDHRPPSDLRHATQQGRRRTGKRLGDRTDPLLVSVRSGAPFSMPGMMDTVLNLGLNAASVHGLAAATDDDRFAWDAYRRFVQMYSSVVIGLPKEELEERLREMKKRRGVKDDTQVPAEGWRELVAEYKKYFKGKTGKEFP